MSSQNIQPWCVLTFLFNNLLCSNIINVSLYRYVDDVTTYLRISKNFIIVGRLKAVPKAKGSFVNVTLKHENVVKSH